MRSARRLLAASFIGARACGPVGATAVEAQEAPLVGDLRPGGLDRGGRSRTTARSSSSACPTGVEDRLYLRVFDPDTGGEHDLVYGAGDDTEMRFSAIRRRGRLSPAPPGPASARRGAARRRQRVARRAAWSAADRRSGRPLADAVLGSRRIRARRSAAGASSASRSRAWPATTPICTRSTLSLRERRNLRARRVSRSSSFAPTVRVPGQDRITELRFRVPADAERLTDPQLRCRQRPRSRSARVPLGAARGLGAGRMAREPRSALQPRSAAGRRHDRSAAATRSRTT